MTQDARRAVEAAWRIEGPRIVATLTRLSGDLGLAEDVAQEAVAEALVGWARDGVPGNTGAWLTTVARRRMVDVWRRRERLEERYRLIAHESSDAVDDAWQTIDDDLLRLVFIACHPALSRESQVALTLRVVAGLTTAEIARMLLVPVATVQARITRAKKTLTAARVPFEPPEPSEWRPRLAGVLGVVYLIFTECHSVAASVEETDWERIVVLYEALGRLAPNPVVELNRAVAVSMAAGPAAGLRIVEELAAAGTLRGSPLIPSVRGELLARLGRSAEARSEFMVAASATANDAQRAVLECKAAALD